MAFVLKKLGKISNTPNKELNSMTFLLIQEIVMVTSVKVGEIRKIRKLRTKSRIVSLSDL